MYVSDMHTYVCKLLCTHLMHVWVLWMMGLTSSILGTRRCLHACKVKNMSCWAHPACVLCQQIEIYHRPMHGLVGWLLKQLFYMQHDKYLWVLHWVQVLVIWSIDVAFNSISFKSLNQKLSVFILSFGRKILDKKFVTSLAIC